MAVQAADCELKSPEIQSPVAAQQPLETGPSSFRLQRASAVVYFDDPEDKPAEFVPDVVRMRRTASGKKTKVGRGMEEGFAQSARDGNMTVTEFSEYLQGHTGHTPPDDVVTRLFRGLDLCDSGCIRFPQFKHFVMAHNDLDPEAVAQVAWGRRLQGGCRSGRAGVTDGMGTGLF